MANRDLRLRRELNETAFHHLLQWLDQGSDSHGERYVEIRDRLVIYFGRRNCPAPDDLADETLNRVARRLEEQVTIDDIVPAHYCYIVARFVLLESLRLRNRESTSLNDIRAGVHSTYPLDDPAVERERTMECLERCLAASSEAERELILEYYRTDEGAAKVQRKRLAERLGLTANSLSIRAWRLRHRIERCVRECQERRQTSGGFVSSE
jgi:DNA-directed RNA polymerase specialized sigma24 family protein